MSVETGSAIIEKWFFTSTDTHNLRTAILPKTSLIAVHHAIMLIHKLLLLVSLPRTNEIMELLEEHYKAYEQYISELQLKYSHVSDPAIIKELNDMKIRLEIAKSHNTFVELLTPIQLIKDHLSALVSTSTAVEGKGVYAVMGLMSQEKPKKRFSLFKRDADSEDGM